MFLCSSKRDELYRLENSSFHTKYEQALNLNNLKSFFCSSSPRTVGLHDKTSIQITSTQICISQNMRWHLIQQLPPEDPQNKITSHQHSLCLIVVAQNPGMCCFLSSFHTQVAHLSYTYCTSKYHLIEGSFLITRSCHNVLVICWNVAAQHWWRLLGLQKRMQLLGYLIYINQCNQKLVRGWNDLQKGDFLNTMYCLHMNQHYFVGKMR